MAQIKLLRGVAVTANPDSPAIKDGQVLFAHGDKAIYLDVGTTRHKIAINPDADLSDIKAKLAGLTEATVVDEIAAEIAKLKKVSVTEAENSDSVTLTIADNTGATSKKIKADVKRSSKSDNQLTINTTVGEEGLYVAPAADAPTYELEKLGTPTTDMAATYKLVSKAPDGTKTDAGTVVIDIPKDMVVQSGSVVTDPTDQPDGTYIELVLANATNDKLYINVGDLIEYVTSGSATGDMIVVTVSADHKVTATITDGTVTKAKLVQAVQDSLDLADSAVQPAELSATKETNKYIAGITVTANGDITIEKEELPSLDAIEWGSF